MKHEGTPTTDPAERWTELRRHAQAVAAAIEARHLDRGDPGAPLRDSLASLRRAGIPAMNGPVEMGGLAATLAQNVEILRIVARGCGSTAWALANHCALTGALRANAEEPLRSRLLAAVRSGAFLGMGTVDPLALLRGGPDVTVTPTPGGTRGVDIDGVQPLVAAFEACTHIAVVARSRDASTAADPLTLLVVPRPGREHADAAPLRWSAMPRSGAHIVTFRALPASLDDVATAGEPAPRVLEALQRWTYLCLSAVFLGLAERAYELAVDAGRGPRLRTMPGVHFALGRMRAQLASMEALLFDACAARPCSDDTPAEAAAQACLPKVYLTNEAVRVVDLALEVIGASECSERSRVAQISHDVRLGPLLPIDGDSARELIGKATLGINPASTPRWV